MRTQYRIHRFLFSGLFLVLICLLPIPQLMAQSQQWDTRWVPNDTFFFGTVSIQNILAYEKEDSDLRKYIAKRMKEEIGVESEQATQIQMILSGELAEDENFGRDGERMMVIKTVFAEAQDFSKITKSTHQEYEEEDFKGKKLLIPDSEYAPAFCFPDDKTMMFGKAEGLKHVLAEERTMSGMVDRIKESDANDTDIFATFEQNATTKKFLEFVSEEADGLPFDLADIGSEAVSGSATIRFSEGKPIVARVKAKDADGAQRLGRAVDALVGLGKTFLPAGRKALEDQPIPDFGDDRFKEFMQRQRELQLEFLDVGEKILEGAATSTEGDLLKIDVTAMGGIGNVVNVFARQIESAMKMGEAQREIIIDEAEIEIEERFEEPKKE